MCVSISSQSLLIGEMAAEPLCACTVSLKWPWSTSSVVAGCSWWRWEKRRLFVSLIFFFFKCVFTTASLLRHLSRHTQSSEVKLNVRSASKQKKKPPLLGTNCSCFYLSSWGGGQRGRVFGLDHSLCCPLLELGRAVRHWRESVRLGWFVYIHRQMKEDQRGRKKNLQVSVTPFKQHGV